MVEVSQIHSSPTPTHHPANPVNSENPKYPTREKKRNPARGLLLLAAGRGPCLRMAQDGVALGQCLRGMVKIAARRRIAWGEQLG